MKQEITKGKELVSRMHLLFNYNLAIGAGDLHVNTEGALKCVV